MVTAGMSKFKVGAMLIVAMNFNVEGHSPEWLHDPCDAKSDIRNRVEAGDGEIAANELKDFNEFLENMYETVSRGQKIEVTVDDSYPNNRRALSRLKNNSKIQVFNSMILRWAMHLQEIMVTIRDDPSRQKIYEEILVHLKRLACEIHSILCHPRKKRIFNGFKPFSKGNWSRSEALLFDMKKVKQLQLFFSECAAVLDGHFSDECAMDLDIHYE